MVDISCTFGLAQLVGERALDVDTDDLVRALGLARAAEHAGRDGVVPDDVYTKALSVLGRALVRVSSRLAEPASSECARDGEVAVRQAFARTSSDHPAYAKRAGNLASAILGLPHDSAHEQRRVAEAAELFRVALDPDASLMQQIDASTNIGHLERRVALLAASSADTGAAREARERSLQHYRSARELAEATGEPAGAIISAMSLLMFDAARFEDVAGREMMGRCHAG